MNKKLLQWGNLITFIVAFAINYLATGLELGGYNTGELSDLLPNLFVPAGLTFSIWGVIYFFLAGFSVYQARDFFKDDKLELDFLNKIGYYFILSNVANATWIVLWHFRLIPFSLIAMLVILGTLLMIYIRLGIGKSDPSKGVRIWVHTPFSIYLGWISVATIANVTAVAIDAGVPSFGFIQEVFTVVVIAVAVLLAFGMLFLRKDWVYSLVIVWATLGIYLKQSGVNFTVSTTALVAVILVSLGIVYTGIKILRK
jgi:hypothetical protein